MAPVAEPKSMLWLLISSNMNTINPYSVKCWPVQPALLWRNLVFAFIIFRLKSIPCIFILIYRFPSRLFGYPIYIFSICGQNSCEKTNRDQYILTLIPVCTSHCMHYNVWDEITYPFQNFSTAIVAAWEWTSYFTPHFPGIWFLIYDILITVEGWPGEGEKVEYWLIR